MRAVCERVELKLVRRDDGRGPISSAVAARLDRLTLVPADGCSESVWRSAIEVEGLRMHIAPLASPRPYAAHGVSGRGEGSGSGRVAGGQRGRSDPRQNIEQVWGNGSPPDKKRFVVTDMQQS